MKIPQILTLIRKQVDVDSTRIKKNGMKLNFYIP